VGAAAKLAILMRILLLGSRHPWRMEAAVERAMRRAGHDTLLFDDRRSRRLVGARLTQYRVLRAARRFEPDFVFLSKCQALTLDTVARVIRDVPNAMWYHDAAYFDRADHPQIAHIVGVGRLARTFFITGFEDEWRSLGLNARLLPAAADRDIVPVPPDPAYGADISFTGTGYDESRAEMLIALSQHFRVRVWGTQWERWKEKLDWSGRPVEGREFAAVCSSSALMLGIHPVVMKHANTAASDRMWMTILAGGVYLGPFTHAQARMLHDGVHCIWYTDLDSCIARARYYLDHPAERERVRADGDAFVRMHHTYDARVPALLA
jgi:hypothetical protein